MQSHWTYPGRPIVVIPVHSETLDNTGKVHPAMVAMMKRFESGYCHGVRVNLGFVQDFLSTCFITKATFRLIDKKAQHMESYQKPKTSRLPHVVNTVYKKHKMIMDEDLELTDICLIR